MKVLLYSIFTTALAMAAPSNPFNRTCPEGSDLTSTTVKPSGLLQIAASQPDREFGFGDMARVTPGDFCTIFNLVIPAGSTTSICTLKFIFPSHKVAAKPFWFKGPGNFRFNGYATGVGAIKETTFNHQPADGPDPPDQSGIVPGKVYTLFSMPCYTSPTEDTTVSGALCSEDTELVFRQTDKKCPIGIFVDVTPPP